MLTPAGPGAAVGPYPPSPMSIRPSRRAVLVCVGIALLALLSTMGSTAVARPPASFYGVQAWSDPGPSEFKRMGRARIGTYRTNLLWSVVEYRQGARNWEPYDSVVASAAA